MMDNPLVANPGLFAYSLLAASGSGCHVLMPYSSIFFYSVLFWVCVYVVRLPQSNEFGLGFSRTGVCGKDDTGAVWKHTISKGDVG